MGASCRCPPTGAAFVSSRRPSSSGSSATIACTTGCATAAATRAGGRSSGWRRRLRASRLLGVVSSRPTGPTSRPKQLEELVAHADVRSADELPGARDPDQAADDHEHADRLQVAAVPRVPVEAEPDDQLDHEHGEQHNEVADVAQLDALGAPGRY